MWNTSLLLSLALTLSLSLGAPVDDSEVELIEPVSSHGDEPEKSFFNIGRSPILVIHGNFPQGFPNFPRVEDAFSRDFLPPVFRDLFAPSESPANNDEAVDVEIIPPPEDKSDSKTPICGLFCRIFADLDKQLAVINRGHGGGGPPISFFPAFAAPSDKANSTYTEKVLPDGSVVKVNQTTYSDLDDNGNAFFFHSSTHVLDGSSDEDAPEEEKSPEGPTKDKRPVIPLIPEEDIGFKLPEDFDPNLNEVSEALDTKRSKRSGREDSSALPSYGGSGHRNSETLIPIGDSDVRVNDLLTESGKRGSLVQIDPDSELIVEVNEGHVVPLDEFQRNQGQWNQQSQSGGSTWNHQQRHSNIMFPEQ